MAKFITTLQTECINDDKWRLIAPLRYESDIAGTITVPAGFECDFASVPRVPIFYMLFGDEAHQAATLHDYLYRYAVVPRKVADEVFREAMSVSGVGWKRHPMYWGVRIFGGLCYA